MRIKINRLTIVRDLKGWTVYRGHNKLASFSGYREAMKYSEAV